MDVYICFFVAALLARKAPPPAFTSAAFFLSLLIFQALKRVFGGEDGVGQAVGPVFLPFAAGGGEFDPHRRRAKIGDDFGRRVGLGDGVIGADRNGEGPAVRQAHGETAAFVIMPDFQNRRGAVA